MQFQTSSKRGQIRRDTCVIKIRALRKDFKKQLNLSDAEDNNPGPIKNGGIADLPLSATLAIH